MGWSLEGQVGRNVGILMIITNLWAGCGFFCRHIVDNSHLLLCFPQRSTPSPAEKDYLQRVVMVGREVNKARLALQGVRACDRVSRVS